MRTSEKGLALIRQFEGLRLRAYRDAVNVPTIGYGHTAGVKMGQEITRERAEELLLAEVERFEGYVDRLVTVPLTQGQFDALVAWTYNLGPGALEKSTMLRRLNAGDYAGAAAELERWSRAGGQVLAGLVRRRAAERALFEGAA